MIIKDESAPHQDPQDIQPPPPEYSEVLARPEPAHAQQPAPATPPQYPPQPSPRTQDNLSPQQRQAQVSQEYRDRCEFPLFMFFPSSQSFCAVLARCANGEHDATTTFGICGIICSILLFPIGLVCLW
jgi:hypothetical protein